MKYDNLPRNSVLTGLSALVFLNHIPTDDSTITTITMKRGTNVTAYKESYKITTQNNNTLSIGIDSNNLINVYRNERLYIELDKFNLTDEQYVTAMQSLEKVINIGILREMVIALKGNIRGVNWQRVDSFAFATQSSKEKYIQKKELLSKMLKDFVFTTTKIEIDAITFLDTERVMNNLPTNNLSPSEINKVIGLKQAYEFLIASFNSFDSNFAKDVNRYVAGNEIDTAGSFRYDQVTIGGTTYLPPILTEEAIQEFFVSIFVILDPRDRAAEYIASAMKLQLFNDGNKRTSFVVGNKILIDAEAGLISVPFQFTRKLLELTKNYYENDYAFGELKDFLLLCMFDSYEEKINNMKQMQLNWPTQ